MTIHPPRTPKPPHKCPLPVHGGYRYGSFSWILAATPWDEDHGGPLDYGTVFKCDCGKYYIAREYSPLLPGWARISRRRGERLIKKSL